MPGTKISQRMRALQLARDCAALGARIRTIHHLTGRPDSRAGGEITGIAIEHHNLRPGETTSVYVIRRGGTR